MSTRRDSRRRDVSELMSALQPSSLIQIADPVGTEKTTSERDDDRASLPRRAPRSPAARACVTQPTSERIPRHHYPSGNVPGSQVVANLTPSVHATRGDSGMRKRLLIGAVASIVLDAAATASAADLTRPVFKAPAAAPAYGWSGPY